MEEEQKEDRMEKFSKELFFTIARFIGGAIWLAFLLILTDIFILGKTISQIF